MESVQQVKNKNYLGFLLFIFNGLFVEYFVYLLLFGLLFIVFLGVKDYVYGAKINFV